MSNCAGTGSGKFQAAVGGSSVSTGKRDISAGSSEVDGFGGTEGDGTSTGQSNAAGIIDVKYGGVGSKIEGTGATPYLESVVDGYVGAAVVETKA